MSKESCVINGNIITKYLKLEKGARQGDLVSTYLSVLCLEKLFMLIKNNKNIKGIKMFKKAFLYTTYADDNTSFLKDKNSMKELFNTFSYFSSSTSLKPNLSKCEVADIGTLKGVKEATYGINCIDLTKEAIKILEVFFSYDKNLQLENNFRKRVSSIKRILKMWKRRNLTIEGKIIIFKTLALSKVSFLAQVSVIPNQVIDALQQI